MRKFGVLLLTVLVLMLAACGKSPAGTPETAAPASAVPSITGASDMEVLLPNGPLPQSAYAPPSPPPRFYEEITHTLLPRDDYGRLWPYVGGYVVQMWMPGDLIGLCDGEGRVVCDPVFNQAEIIEKDGKSLYKLTENRADAEWKNVSKITLCKPDGSWSHEYEGVAWLSPADEIMERCNFCWRQPLLYDFITVRENGRWGVIDYEGAEILPCVYNEPVCFSQGLAAVTSDDGESFSFIDSTGAVVLGPYTAPPQQKNEWDFTGGTLPRNHGMLFSEGLARFYENGKYGAIDKSGRVVIPAQYDFITSFYKGTALIAQWKGDNVYRGVIDTAGRVLYEPGDIWFQHTDDGTIILDTPGGPVAFDPATGAETPWVNKDSAAGASYSMGSDGVVIYWDDGQQSFPDASNVAFLDNGNLALSNRSSETWYIADRSGERVAGPFDGRAEYFMNGFIYVSAGMSGLRDGTDTTYHTLCDRDGNRVLPELYREIIPFDGRFLVRQDTCAGLLDEKGNWVIKAPIYDYLND